MSDDLVDAPGELTVLLRAWKQGDVSAQERLIQLVYAELRGLAASQLGRERRDHTLQPTALVHEVLLRLLGRQPAFDNRRHFFGAAGRAMRQVLVDHARRRNSAKRGEGSSHEPLDEVQLPAQFRGIDLLALDLALDRLEALAPEQARLVELRYFVGLTLAETAEALGVHPSAVSRGWTAARAWLRKELSVPEAP